MRIDKEQDRSISRTLRIDLHKQLYVALFQTMNPQNVFICTGNGSKFTKDTVFSEIFYTTKTYVKNTMSVTSINATQQKAIRNRMSISYVLNSEISQSKSGRIENIVEVISTWTIHQRKAVPLPVLLSFWTLNPYIYIYICQAGLTEPV